MGTPVFIDSIKESRSVKETMKKIWNVVSTVLVAVFVLCAVFLMGSRILGYKVYTVISGSMEPTYSVGDLLYVKSVDVNTIKVGDPITFVLNENLVVATHRVVRIDQSAFLYKGRREPDRRRRPGPFQQRDRRTAIQHSEARLRFGFHSEPAGNVYYYRFRRHSDHSRLPSRVFR